MVSFNPSFPPTPSCVKLTKEKGGLTKDFPWHLNFQGDRKNSCGKLIWKKAHCGLINVTDQGQCQGKSKNSLITLNVSDVGQCSKGHDALNVQMFQEMFIC